MKVRLSERFLKSHERPRRAYLESPGWMIGIALLTRVTLLAFPMTFTGVPTWTRAKKSAARSLGIRTQPCDAG